MSFGSGSPARPARFVTPGFGSAGGDAEDGWGTTLGVSDDVGALTWDPWRGNRGRGLNQVRASRRPLPRTIPAPRTRPLLRRDRDARRARGFLRRTVSP